MPQYRINKINYVVTGNKEDIVNLDAQQVDNNGNVVSAEHCNWSYVTDTGSELKYDSGLIPLDLSSNLHRLYNLDSNGDIDSSDSLNFFAAFDFKDVAVRTDTGNQINPTKLAIYGPHLSVDPIGFVQAEQTDGSYVRGLTQSTVDSPMVLHTDLLDTRYDRLTCDTNSLFWQYKLESDGNPTYVYIPMEFLEKNHKISDEISTYTNVSSLYEYLSSFGALSSNHLSSLFIPAYNLKNVEKNYIYTFDFDLGSINSDKYHDFNNGDMILGMGEGIAIGKNPYDSTYSMNMTDKKTLSNARKYVGIGFSGGKPYFKYYDDVNYEMNVPYGDDMHADLSGNVKTYGTTEKESIPGKHPYQKVEIQEAMNRFSTSWMHKSNMYSLTIKNLNLDSTNHPNLSANLDKIKSDIQKTVRMIAEELAPAHTQLLDVYIDE